MRKLLFCLMILVFPLLTGCGDDGGVGFWGGSGWGGGFGGGGIFFGSNINKSTLTPKDIALVNNIKSSARDNGFIVTDSSTPNTISFKAYKRINNDISDFVNKDGSTFITVRSIKSKNYNKINVVIDLTNRSNPELAKIISHSKTNLGMDIPVQASYTNAQIKTNNNKRLQWNLIPGKKNLIEADFEMDKTIKGKNENGKT